MRQKIEEHVVTVGGGTGSFTILSELKKYAARLSAVVAMTDSGGSSRRLMDEFGRPLPLGDLRQALVAMSRSTKLWNELFSYRFPDVQGGSVGGHSLGNLILAALQEINEGDLLAALDDAEDILNCGGKVVPVTLTKTTLCAELSDGSILRGESTIDRAELRKVLPITRVFLADAACATPSARKALLRADKILIGPGDLFTSVIPCLLVDGIAEAIRSCDGEIVYVCNVMTKYGETDGYRASDFLREITRYLGRTPDTVVVNTAEFPRELLQRYLESGSSPVIADIPDLERHDCRVLADRFYSAERLIRHDADRVIRAIWPPTS